jgi:hypothetical protein
MGLNLTNAALIAIAVYAVVLAILIAIMRPTARRATGIFVGAVAATVVGVGFEAFAHARGLWTYVDADTPIGPVFVYPLNVLTFAIVAVIGWRIGRRFGARGEVSFVLITVFVSVPRDYFEAYQLFHVVEFGPGTGPWILDALAWVVLTTVTLVVMRRVAGPPNEDR